MENFNNAKFNKELEEKFNTLNLTLEREKGSGIIAAYFRAKFYSAENIYIGLHEPRNK